MPEQNLLKNFRCLAIAFAMCPFFSQSSFAAEMSGTVVKVQDQTIMVRLNDMWIPDEGDPITFFRHHPTLGKVSVGEGLVLDMRQAPLLIVNRISGEGQIPIGTEATVHSQSTKRVEAKKEIIRFPDPIKLPEDESLIKAVKDGHVEAANNVLARGANVNAAGEKGRTPLMIASQMGNVIMAQALLNSGAALNIETKNSGLTALKLAARHGHIPIADVLLDRGADIDHRGFNNNDDAFAGASALAHAAAKGQASMVTHLIARGANPNLENYVSLTPLIYAVGEEKIESVNALLNAGVLVDQPSSLGLTPLMAAAQSDWKLVAYLLGAGANPNRQISEAGTALNPDAPGMTALMISVLIEDEKSFFTILLSGADPTIKRADGKAAFDLAIDNLKKAKPSSNEYETQERIQRALLQPDWGKQKAMEIVAKALEHEIDRNNLVIVAAGLRLGVDPNVLVKGEPLFFEAIREGNLSMVKLMLDHGADPNVKEPDGSTAFYFSMYRKKFEVARLLIAQGADPNILPDEEVLPLLHEFAMNGDVEGVKLLLSVGMNVNARDKRQNTPLHLAAKLGEVETFKILLEAGADPTLKNKYGHRPTDQIFDSRKVPLFLELVPGMATNNSPEPSKPLTRQEQISEAKNSKTDEFDLGDLDF